MSGGPRSSETCSRDAGKEWDLGDSSKSNHGVRNAEVARNTRREDLHKEDLKEGQGAARAVAAMDRNGAMVRMAATVSAKTANLFQLRA